MSLQHAIFFQPNASKCTVLLDGAGNAAYDPMST